MSKIHPTAIVHPNAKIDENVTIGPFCIVGENVSISEGTELVSNVIIDGHTKIGKNNRIFHSAVIGTAPQDLKYNGEPTEVIIGDNNNIREFVTINRSAILGEPTTIGNNNLLMTYMHVAHNCIIGNNVIIANAVNLAGHIEIDDFVTVGGMTAIHQFVKIGKYAFVGGASGVKKDVPPFTRGEGMPYKVVGLNSVGLQRKGFSKESILTIKKIYNWFYKSKMNVSQALNSLESYGELGEFEKIFVDFIKKADRGICRSM